jgi:hypothetical protein
MSINVDPDPGLKQFNLSLSRIFLYSPQMKGFSMIFYIEVYHPFSIWPTKSSLDPMRSRSSRNSGGGVTLKQKISRFFSISHACT